MNRKKELVLTKGEEAGNRMIGIAYILKEDAGHLKEQSEKLFGKRGVPPVILGGCSCVGREDALTAERSERRPCS